MGAFLLQLKFCKWSKTLLQSPIDDKTLREQGSAINLLAKQIWWRGGIAENNPHLLNHSPQTEGRLTHRWQPQAGGVHLPTTTYQHSTNILRCKKWRRKILEKTIGSSGLGCLAPNMYNKIQQTWEDQLHEVLQVCWTCLSYCTIISTHSVVCTLKLEG